MKKFYVMIAALVAACGISAKVITLDPSSATDMAENAITYNADGVMDSTYSTSWQYQYLYTNEQDFSLSHLTSGNNFSGSFWEGFTFSRRNVSSKGDFECLAKGGVAGEGTPFVVGYYSEYNVKDGVSNCQVLFEDELYPSSVKICQNANTYDALIGNNTIARKFTAKDTLALVISAIDAGTSAPTGEPVIYYLAVDSIFNTAWVTVDLSAIGATHGLDFKMTSTDKGEWGINTPTYFCMDALTISTEPIESAIEDVRAGAKVEKVIRNGKVIILRDGKAYDVTGVEIR